MKEESPNTFTYFLFKPGGLEVIFALISLGLHRNLAEIHSSLRLDYEKPGVLPSLAHLIM